MKKKTKKKKLSRPLNSRLKNNKEGKAEAKKEQEEIVKITQLNAQMPHITSRSREWYGVSDPYHSRILVESGFARLVHPRGRETHRNGHM